MTTRREFVERTTRRRADTRPAKITARNSDGTYAYVDTRTGQAGRAAPQRPRDSFAVGQYVTITSPDSSRNVKGAGSVIIGTSPEEARAVSGGARIAAQGFAHPFVSSALPSPLRIPIGFATPRELVIRGFSLTTAPTYEDPGLVDDSAPVITASTITCQLRAESPIAAGPYDLTIHGRTFADQIECYDVGEEVFVAGYLYQDLGGGSDVDYPCVVVFDASTWTILRTVMGFSAIGTYPDASSGIVRVDELIHCMVTDPGATIARIFTVSADPDDLTSRDSGNIADATIDPQTQVVWNGAKLAFVSRSPDRKLYAIDADGTDKVTVATLTTDYRGIHWDGTYYWVTDPANGVARVTTTGTELAVAGASGYDIAHSGPYVYVPDKSTGFVRKITASTATLTASLNTGGQPYAAVVVGTNLYVSLVASGATRAVVKIDLGTFTVSDTLVIASSDIRQMTVSRDGLSLWCMDFQGNGYVHRIELAGFTVAESHDVNLFSGNFYANAVEVY